MSRDAAEHSGGSNGSHTDRTQHDEHFWIGAARGFGGALLFSMPILMTMEMWRLGFYMDRWKLALFVGLLVPMILALSYFAGIKDEFSLTETVLDGMTAFAIGILTTVLVLFLLGIIDIGMAPREIVGKIAILSPTSAFGAILARAQLGGSGNGEQKEKKQRFGYPAELFFVAAGAFYLAATVASTEEMILIPFKMKAWHAAGLLVFSLLVMHAFLYTMKFKGAPEEPPDTPWWSILVRYTMPGYLVVLLVCWYLLWTFDRFESYDPHWMAMYTIALAFPGAVGGAAGRLIL
jgi:putative integral membrane protein (TIGR02587 family)